MIAGILFPLYRLYERTSIETSSPLLEISARLDHLRSDFMVAET